MKRFLCVIIVLITALSLYAQGELILTLQDTVLTTEQVAAKNSNPSKLVYPLKMKDKIPAINCNQEVAGLGPFSVSEKKKVMFSKGNLQFNAGSGTHKCADGTEQQGTWRFAEHQWDYVGNDELGSVYYNGQKSSHKQMSETYDGWIDLFGWGTSGWNSGASLYQPWSTYQSSPNYYPGGSSENNLTGEYAYADWGLYNKIGNNAPLIWRTLTYDEWVYLYKSRPNASLLFGNATVNGVAGFVLLPDDWVTPEEINFIPGMSLSFTENVFSMYEWEKMETLGAVFLPAAGWRNGTTAYDLEAQGFYWTATQYEKNKNYAWYFNFAEKSSGMKNIYRHNGHSVRVVHDL